MNKSRLLVIIVCLFWVHSQVAATSNLGTLPLTPPGKVSPIEANQETIFLKKFNILALALAMYCLEADKRLPEDDFKKCLADEVYSWKEKFGVIFDLDNIIKHGFTRDYPFTVKDKSFIIRIFDARDGYHVRRRLPDEIKILYEGEFKEGIRFQILPGINTILEDKEIEPHEVQCTQVPLGSS